jgi:hypothetical protein
LLDDADYYVDEEGRQDDAAAANGNGGNGNGQTTGSSSAVTAPPGSSQVSTVGTSTIPGLICVPVASCPVPNIYGTRPAHFLRFGFVSPSAVRCDATAGQILCVQEAAATTPTTAETTTATTEAETTTSTEATTTTTTTEGTTTTQETEATTAAATTAAGTPPPPTVQMLECRRVADCAVVYGTQADHFTRFGEQAACSNGMVRCVTARPTATTTPSPVGPTPPVFTAGLPVGPVAPSVSIIGPQPIYVSYNNVIGPTVGGCCGGGIGDIAPGKVSSAGASPAQEREINSLLQGLRSRLQSIITSFRS